MAQPAKAERYLSFPALILAFGAGQEHLEGRALLREPWWQRCPSASPCQSSVSRPISERGNQFTLASGTGKMLSVKDYAARKANLKVQTPISSPMSQLKHQMETIQKVILSCSRAASTLLQRCGSSIPPGCEQDSGSAMQGKALHKRRKAKNIQLLLAAPSPAGPRCCGKRIPRHRDFGTVPKCSSGALQKHPTAGCAAAAGQTLLQQTTGSELPHPSSSCSQLCFLSPKLPTFSFSKNIKK